MSNEMVLDCDFSKFKEIDKFNPDFKRMYNKVKKVNYTDGVADGRERLFQSGFDDGWVDGFTKAFELAKFSGFYETLDFQRTICLELQEERQKFTMTQTKIPRDYESDILLTNLRQNEKSCINNLKEIFTSKMPTTSNLLSE